MKIRRSFITNSSSASFILASPRELLISEMKHDLLNFFKANRSRLNRSSDKAVSIVLKSYDLDDEFLKDQEYHDEFNETYPDLYREISELGLGSFGYISLECRGSGNEDDIYEQFNSMVDSPGILKISDRLFLICMQNGAP
jgi:hypothetical protein